MNLGALGRIADFIPRLAGPEDWPHLGLVRRWLITARCIAFVMTLGACILAALLAGRQGPFSPFLWLLLLLGLIGAHGTNNILNDLFDHGHGSDEPGYFRNAYASHPLAEGLLTRRQLWGYAIATGATALAVGLYLVHLRGPVVLALLVAGVFFAVCYNFPLKQIGLGEPAVALVWGPLMIAGGVFVLRGAWHWDVVLASCPYGLATATVLLGKHIEKRAADRAKRIFTLPVVLGDARARRLSVVIMVSAYVATFIAITRGALPLTCASVLLGLPWLCRAGGAFLRMRPVQRPADYPVAIWPVWYVGIALWHSSAFGLWLAAGLAADLMIASR